MKQIEHPHPGQGGGADSTTTIEAARRRRDKRAVFGWTEDPSELRAFPYVEYGKHAGRRGFTRAVIDRAHRRDRGSGRGSGLGRM